MSARIPTTIALCLLLAPACRTSVTPSSPASAERAVDLSGLLADAWRASEKGDVEETLRAFRELDAAGWSIPPASDFSAVAARGDWKEIAARIAAREPRTGRSEVAFTLPEEGLIAEGMASDPRDGSLFVGSVRRRKVVRVDPSGATRDFASGLGRVLGLKVDVRRDLLWAVANPGGDGEGGTRSGLHAFDLESGAPRLSAVLEGEGHRLNDLALATDGSVYVTDSRTGLLYRLPAGETALVTVPASFRSPNGIAFADGVLVVCDERGLWTFADPAEAPRQLVAPGGLPLGGIDGLSARGLTLVAIQNALGAPRVVRLDLSAGATAVLGAEVLETRNDLWHIPTTGTFLGDDFLYIGNSHVDASRDEVLRPEANVPTRLHRLRVPGSEGVK
jgi:hypothetical protein